MGTVLLGLWSPHPKHCRVGHPTQQTLPPWDLGKCEQIFYCRPGIYGQDKQSGAPPILGSGSWEEGANSFCFVLNQGGEGRGGGAGRPEQPSAGFSGGQLWAEGLGAEGPFRQRGPRLCLAWKLPEAPCPSAAAGWTLTSVSLLPARCPFLLPLAELQRGDPSPLHKPGVSHSLPPAVGLCLPGTCLPFCPRRVLLVLLRKPGLPPRTLDTEPGGRGLQDSPGRVCPPP